MSGVFSPLRVARTAAVDPQEVARTLVDALGPDPAAVIVFHDPKRDGAGLARALTERLGHDALIGCSSAGEISTGELGHGTVVAAALGSDRVKRAAVTCHSLAPSLPAALAAAVRELEERLGSPLRDLDPQRHVGLIFLDSVHGIEEAVLVHLGNVAPLLRFVGGSAADELAFAQVQVLGGARASRNGFALMVLELEGPFEIVKGCHFGPVGPEHVVTRAEGRLLHELDGRPAVEVYCEHIGCAPEQFNFETLFQNPIGLVIAGEAWLRQASPPFRVGGSVFLGCEIAEGSVVHFMKPSAPLIEHTGALLDQVRGRLGEIRGALTFDCALRRLELDAAGTGPAYAALFSFPTAGYFTHGESFVSHMHQTFTGLFFG